MSKIGVMMFVFLTQLLMAEKIEITSSAMHAENLKKQIHFVGNAKIKKETAWLYADEIIVAFTKTNQAKMYKAKGNVRFEFNEKGRHYKGEADRVTYYPLKGLYKLYGHAKIEDMINKSHVDGNEITLDMRTGNASVKSDKRKPVKFVIEVKEQ